MYYYYNKNVGLIPCNTRKESIQLMNENTNKPIKRVSINSTDQYKEYQQAYEAILLYIIKKANEEYPEYLTKKKIGELFTLVMLRWYTVYKKSYTHEKPIRAGHIKKYKGNIGFIKFEDYYENIARVLKYRRNDNGWYVLWTELELGLVKDLVDNPLMIKTVDKAVFDGKYSKNAQRTIKQLYNKLPSQYKTKNKIS